MKKVGINLKQAVRLFYPTTKNCLLQVYLEAIANALDAGAKTISISIKAGKLDDSKAFSIEISDDGAGFTDDRFARFADLMNVDNEDHKGLGRLAFLANFARVEVESYYARTKRRKIILTYEGYDGGEPEEVEPHPSGTRILLSGYSKKEIYAYDLLKPSSLKISLIDHFYPRLYSSKQDNNAITIGLSLSTEAPSKTDGYYSDTQKISDCDIVQMATEDVHVPDDFFKTIKVSYSIEHSGDQKGPRGPRSLTSSLVIDNRAMPIDLGGADLLPIGCHVRVHFSSTSLIGKTDATRQELSSSVPQTVKDICRQIVIGILEREIPQAKSRRDELRVNLSESYPHLSGYFKDGEIGLVKPSDLYVAAEERFIKSQKEILDSRNLDDDSYRKAVNISARTLMAYVLYREKIIDYLAKSTEENSEGELHDWFIPRRTEGNAASFDDTLYHHNLWLLDDKFMSYTKVLSDRPMSELLKTIANIDEQDEKRPDIAIVFSANPEAEVGKFDVVIVELKKHDVDLAEQEEVVSQLRQRARKLLKYYPDKINRMWFYGIADIDKEFKTSLRELKFRELFSSGTTMYSQQEIAWQDDERQPMFPVDMFVMDYKALIGDAKSRNETFMKVLRHAMAAFVAQ